MKKLLALATVLFAALMLTSAPASAQQFVLGLGHGDVRIRVGGPIYAPAYAPSICGYDQWNRPVYCQPAPDAYYGDCYDYGCGYGNFYGYDPRYYGYGRRYEGPRYDYRGGRGGFYENRGGNRGNYNGNRGYIGGGRGNGGGVVRHR